MGSFGCKCGYTMKLKTEVEPYQKTLTSNLFINEKVIGFFHNMESIESDTVWIDKKSAQLDEFYLQFDSHSQSVIHCPKCDRIHVHQGNNKWVSYARED